MDYLNPKIDETKTLKSRDEIFLHYVQIDDF